MLDPFVRRFIRASLLWLGCGVVAGMVAGFILRVHLWRAGSALLGMGGMLSAAGAFFLHL